MNVHKTAARSGRPSPDGFTLVETLVAGMVLVVGLIMIAQFFASAMARTTASDVRSILSQVANREIEDVRALLYDDVGTTDGWPKGVLAPTATRTEDGVAVTITREVVFVTDDSYSGPYPANYKRVSISVSATQHPALGPVAVSTYVAGGAEGGTLDITVTDTQGTPVPNAQIAVTNTHLIPNVNLTSSALRTNSLGKLIIPGLKPDTEYRVSASSPATTQPSQKPPSGQRGASVHRRSPGDRPSLHHGDKGSRPRGHPGSGRSVVGYARHRAVRLR